MSLIHRVTSIDGPDRELNHGGGTVRSVRRVISYDAFHPVPTEDTPQQDHHAHHPLKTVTAYKVSTAKRIGTFLGIFGSFSGKTHADFGIQLRSFSL
jgi:hypothetical protein